MLIFIRYRYKSSASVSIMETVLVILANQIPVKITRKMSQTAVFPIAVIFSLSVAFTRVSESLVLKETRNYGVDGSSRSIGYGLNGVPLTWAEARKECQSWGATLAFPNSLEEAETLRGFMLNLDNSTKEIHLGFHSAFVNGDYITLAGRPLDQGGYRKWNPESENASHQLCGAMTLAGMKTIECSTIQESVCEFTTTSAYEQIEDFGLYAFHEDARNWTDAVATCHIESAYLLILRSVDEYDAVRAHLVESGVVVDNVTLLYGAHQLFADHMFVTLADELLEEAGYNVWAPDEPGEFPLVNLVLSDAGSPNARPPGLCTGPNDVPLPFVCKRDLH